MGRRIENLHLFSARLQPDEVHRSLYSYPYQKYGFLGREDNLDDVLKYDAVQVQLLGITFDDIASKIEELFLSDESTFNGNPLVRKEYTHSPLCPWGDYCTVFPLDTSLKVTEIILFNGQREKEVNTFREAYPDLPVQVYRRLIDNDLAMVFSDLHPHLIRGHKFCEGFGTPYRVDPQRTVRYLGIPHTPLSFVNKVKLFAGIY
ncbi:hypothetical protein HZB02_01510 [Candidatus Woesearchaeota archaeon]|nr:hypothetical protein [Candidatus Woesearchaeota archaeon]